MLEELRRRSPRRAVELQGQKARFRVRPDEAAFAAAEPQVPVTFDEAVAESVEVKTLLLDGPSKLRDP